ncbi:TKPR1, partial [Symbiodinium sp. CCMP2456]
RSVLRRLHPTPQALASSQRPRSGRSHKKIPFPRRLWRQPPELRRGLLWPPARSQHPAPISRCQAGPQRCHP